MLTDLTENLLQLSNLIKIYKEKLNFDNADAVELLNIQSEIENTITSFSILFQKIPKVQKTFEAVRDYYITEVLHKYSSPNEKNP